jgi:hypothetical protein
MDVNDLLIMEDYDENKSDEKYEFVSIPIWVRIFNLPLERMNRDTCEAMGDIIGQYISVYVGEDGMAQGKYLRMKVRLQVSKPLMRGMLVQVGAEGKEKWCRFEYEYLHAFCWTCGIMGHVGKACSIKLKKGEVQQYGTWLKYDMNQRASQSWDRASRGNSRNSESKWFGSRASGDKLTWRKGSGEQEVQTSRQGAIGGVVNGKKYPSFESKESEGVDGKQGVHAPEITKTVLSADTGVQGGAIVIQEVGSKGQGQPTTEHAGGRQEVEKKKRSAWGMQ